jgi:hypothetical protein
MTQTMKKNDDELSPECQKIYDFIDMESHESYARLFMSVIQRRIIVFCSSKERVIYIWNNKFRFYEKIDFEVLIQLISQTLNPVLRDWKHTAEEELEQRGKTKRKSENKSKRTKNRKDEEDDSDEVATALEFIIDRTKSSIINKIENNTYKNSIAKEVVSLNIISSKDMENINTLDNFLNFENYKVDLKTLEISERETSDFITSLLPYEFQPKCNKTIKKEIKEALLRICNNDPELLEFILCYFGYCITSETAEQNFLYCVGPSASNGKSTIIKMLKKALPIYVFKAKKDLFSIGNSKTHKYFTGMKDMRIVYTEELDKGKIDGDLLKDVVDGDTINNEVLFGTTEPIDINFKLMFFSNNLMNFDNDAGIERRTITTELKSKFVPEADYETEKASNPNVFVKDPHFLDKFDSPEYKNALVHLLLPYAKKYFKDGITVPEKIKKTTKELCNENDKMKSFIDTIFETTGKDEDRIHKDTFKDLYNNYYKCNFAWTSILTEIKRCNLNYDREKRVNGNRGVIIGIKQKSNNQHRNEEPTFIDSRENDLDYNPEDDLKKTKEHDELKEKNKSLEEENNNIKQKYEDTLLERKNEIESLKKQLESLKKLLETKNEMIQHKIDDNLVNDYVKTEKQKIDKEEKKEIAKKSVGVNKDFLKKIKEKEKQKVLVGQGP